MVFASPAVASFGLGVLLALQCRVWAMYAALLLLAVLAVGVALMRAASPSNALSIYLVSSTALQLGYVAVPLLQAISLTKANNPRDKDQ